MKKVFICFLVTLLVLIVTSTGTSAATTGTTERVSVSSIGIQADNQSGDYFSISGDGRYVAFDSRASNLVEGDTNRTRDIFVFDRKTKETTRVSISSNGTQGNKESIGPTISADGRYIAFSSSADNLVEGDTNGLGDVFIHDRQTGNTSRVSTNGGGQPSISGDGRYVAFISAFGWYINDLYVHDCLTGENKLISLNKNGVRTTGWSLNPAISADGRYVSFESNAIDLVEGDTNGFRDIFVHDVQTGKTKRVSVSSKGEQGNNESMFTSSISADGRYIAFQSRASNLVEGDITGGIFVRDQVDGITIKVSNGLSPSISADGRYVAYHSGVNNLVEGDTNNATDVFIYDISTGKTEFVSLSDKGLQGNGNSSKPSINADGSCVAFISSATNLVENDTNGYQDIFVRDLKGISDSIPPETVIGVKGAIGQNEWYTSNVEVSFTATDNEGGSGVAQTEYSFDDTNWITYTTPFTVTTEGTTTLYFRSTDNAGNVEETKEQIIQIDRTSPIMTGAPTTSPNANGWYNNDVTVQFNASDDVSGIGTVTSDTAISTEGTGQSVTGTATDKAGNSASYTVDGINVDLTEPQVTVNIADGAEFLLNENVIVDWSAADDLSGLASAEGTGHSGQGVNTSSVGEKTFTVTAADNAGNQVTKTVTYYVRYDFSGILKPIDEDGSSVFKQGSTVPVKFRLQDANGDSVTNATGRLYLAKVENGVVGEEMKAVSTSAATEDNLFRYDNTDDLYIFNLSTKELSVGRWQLRIELDDESSKGLVVLLK